MLELLFNKAPGLTACNFIKKRLHYRGLPVKFAKFLRTPFFTEPLQLVFLKNGLLRKYEISPVYITEVTQGYKEKNRKKINMVGVENACS